MRRVAASRMSREAGGLTLQPTALVHEAWLKLSTSDDGKWNDREHFFRYATLSMRRILVESARSKRARRSKLHSFLEAESLPGLPEQSPEDHLQRIDECLQILEQRDPESTLVDVPGVFNQLGAYQLLVRIGEGVANVKTIRVIPAK